VIQGRRDHKQEKHPPSRGGGEEEKRRKSTPKTIPTRGTGTDPRGRAGQHRRKLEKRAKQD